MQCIFTARQAGQKDKPPVVDWDPVTARLTVIIVGMVFVCHRWSLLADPWTCMEPQAWGGGVPTPDRLSMDSYSHIGSTAQQGEASLCRPLTGLHSDTLRPLSKWKHFQNVEIQLLLSVIMWVTWLILKTTCAIVRLNIVVNRRFECINYFIPLALWGIHY